MANLISVQERLKKLDEVYPGWDTQVYDYYEKRGEVESDEQEKILDEFSKLVDTTIQEAQENKLEKDEILKLFEGRAVAPIIEVFVSAELDLFWACQPLVELEKRDKYMAERVLDLIWEQYIVRFNEDLQPYQLKRKEFERLCVELQYFTDKCIRRQLHQSTIETDFKKRAGLSSEVCQYFTDKINANWTDLKLNYIIQELREVKRITREPRTLERKHTEN